jgi:hypothetical protein
MTKKEAWYLGYHLGMQKYAAKPAVSRGSTIQNIGWKLRPGSRDQKLLAAGRRVVQQSKPVGGVVPATRLYVGQVGSKVGEGARAFGRQVGQVGRAVAGGAKALGRQAGQAGRYAAAGAGTAATGVTTALGAPTIGTALAAAPLATAGLVAGAGAAGYGVGRGISYLTGQDKPESWAAGKLAPLWGRTPTVKSQGGGTQPAIRPGVFGPAAGRRPQVIQQGAQPKIRPEVFGPAAGKRPQAIQQAVAAR